MLYTVYLFVTNELRSITMLIITDVFNWVSQFFEFRLNSTRYANVHVCMNDDDLFAKNVLIRYEGQNLFYLNNTKQNID